MHPPSLTTSCTSLGPCLAPALRSTVFTALLGLLVLPALGCGPGAPLPSEGVDESFEAFEARTWRESGTGFYIVDGDQPVRTREELRELYEALHSPVSHEGLAVYNVGGTDKKWSSAQQRSLTYCVSTHFGFQYGATVQAMATAAAAWEQVSNVDFIHRSDQDSACDAFNGNVLFDVNPVSTQPYLARAFFPGYSRADRNILVDTSAFEDLGTWTLAGIMRHELGHVLGFRHEHTRPEAGTCFEDGNWRALTSYDPGSVMHYPQCQGTQAGDLVLTARDAEGAASLYPFPRSHRRSDLFCNYPESGDNHVTWSSGNTFSGGILYPGWCMGSHSRFLTAQVN